MHILIAFLAGLATSIGLLLHLRYQSPVPGALALLSIVWALNRQPGKP